TKLVDVKQPLSIRERAAQRLGELTRIKYPGMGSLILLMIFTLIDALKDKEPSIQYAAVKNLGKLERVPEAVVLALLGFLGDVYRQLHKFSYHIAGLEKNRKEYEEFCRFLDALLDALQTLSAKQIYPGSFMSTSVAVATCYERKLSLS